MFALNLLPVLASCRVKVRYGALAGATSSLGAGLRAATARAC